MATLSTVIILLSVINHIRSQRASPAQQNISCGQDHVTLKCPAEAIHIISVHLGVSSSEHCSHKDTDCTVPVQTVNGDYFQQITNSCDGKMNCTIEVSSTPISGQCPSNGVSSYVLIEYRCVGKLINNKYMQLGYAGESFNMQLCSMNSSVHIDNVAFGVGTCNEHESNKYKKKTISAKCKRKRACTDLKGYDAASFHGCTSANNPDISTVLWYICQSNNHLAQVSRCVNESFDDILCQEQGTGIHIVNTFFGDMGTKQVCSQDTISEKDCRTNVNDTEPGYAAEILEKCEGQQQCTGLVARRNAKMTWCNRDWNQFNEYVTIVYTCKVVDSVEIEEIQTRGTPNTTYGRETTFQNIRRPVGELNKDVDEDTESGNTLHILGDEDQTFWTLTNILIVVGATSLTVVVIGSVVLGITCRKWKNSNRLQEPAVQKTPEVPPRRRTQQETYHLSPKGALSCSNSGENANDDDASLYVDIHDKDVFSDQKVLKTIQTLYGVKPSKENSENPYSQRPIPMKKISFDDGTELHENKKYMYMY